MSNSLWPHGLQPTRFLCSWDFSRQEYWSGFTISFSRRSSQPGDWTQVSRKGFPFPSPGDLSKPGIEPVSPVCQMDSLPLNHQESPLSTTYWLNSEALWGRSDCQQRHSLCSSSKGKYLSPVAPTLGCLSIALIYVDPWRSHTAKGTLVLPDQFWVICYTLEAGSRISPTSSLSSDNRKKRVL